MKELLNNKKSIIIILIIFCIGLIIGILAVKTNKNKRSEKENISDIINIYYQKGSSSVYKKYELNKQDNNYILKYEEFNTGEIDNKELEVDIDKINNFISNEGKVDKNYYENNQNNYTDGGTITVYMYTTKSGANIYLKSTNNTETFFKSLVE